MIFNSHIGYFNNALLSVKSCNKLYIIIINSYAGQREFFKKANIISFLLIICIFTLIQEKIAAIMLTGQWLTGIRISDLIVFEIHSIWPN